MNIKDIKKLYIENLLLEKDRFIYFDSVKYSFEQIAKEIENNTIVGDGIMEDLFDTVIQLLNKNKEIIKEMDKSNNPILVGCLNRPIGFNGFKPSEIGTSVYELDGKYYIEIISLKDDSIKKIFYYKESLISSITFI